MTNNNWMPPKEYFERIVAPTVKEYLQDKKNHHKENAIFQLSSFSERFYGYHEKNGNTEKIFGVSNEKNFRATVFEQHPEWGLLWDFANGVKHHFPDERRRYVSDAWPTSTQSWEHEEYDMGGRWVTLDQAIITVYKFWKKLLDDDSNE